MPPPSALPRGTPGSEGGRLSSPLPLGTWATHGDGLQGLTRQGGCCRVRGCLVAASAMLRGVGSWGGTSTSSHGTGPPTSVSPFSCLPACLKPLFCNASLSPACSSSVPKGLN